ncbi:Ig-like domain-containing protein [Microbacterium oxydans]|uniref:Ig-like domain-containing protein n=1 Tax=Microbacterium oxydans TaxID=82380 RepID=UPI0024AD1AE8|nr:Ig-like domain-containing protein [Microbacterium oxydans]
MTPNASFDGLQPFDIIADTGEVIGTVTASAPDTLVVTLAPYVDTHTALTGSVTLQARFNAASATPTPTAIPILFAVSDGSFPTTVNGYVDTDISQDFAGVAGGTVSGSTLTWNYYLGTPLSNVDLALMDGATGVDCAALQLTYRDAPWADGDPYPDVAAFGPATPVVSATCGAITPGLDAATQVVSLTTEAVVPEDTMREFQLVANITSPAQPQFQAVFGTTDGASEQSAYFSGYADRVGIHHPRRTDPASHPPPQHRTRPLGTSAGRPAVRPPSGPPLWRG